MKRKENPAWNILVGEIYFCRKKENASIVKLLFNFCFVNLNHYVEQGISNVKSRNQFLTRFTFFFFLYRDFVFVFF